MEILSNITSITTEFVGKIQENHVKYREKKANLKKVIAETARSQAQMILEDESDDNMGNPADLCNKLAELRLQYNSIIVKQKEESDKIMSEYSNAIYLCLQKIDTNTINIVEKATIFDRFCHRGFQLNNLQNLTSESTWPRNLAGQRGGSMQIQSTNMNFNCRPQNMIDNYTEIMNRELEKIIKK